MPSSETRGHNISEAAQRDIPARGDWPPSRTCKPAVQSLHSQNHASEFTLRRVCGGTSGPGKAEPMRSQHARGNVFVANLPPEFSDDQLAETFDSFGIVLSASVARDPTTGKKLRYGFVDIATERAAKRAVESMNGAAGMVSIWTCGSASDRLWLRNCRGRVLHRGVRRFGWQREPITMTTRRLLDLARARSRDGSRHFRWNVARCRGGLAKPPAHRAPTDWTN